MQYTVNRGDSLWRLAVQYQGSGTQWPKLVEHHNNYVASRGPHSGLLRIEDPNLIFVGQTLFLPPKAKRIERGQGEEQEANGLAKPYDLKVNYGISRDTPPCVWTSHSVEFDIKAELSGDIIIEMVSDSRHRHNLEIALSRDSIEAKQKLKKLYDPVISKLLAEPSVKFENGKVKLNSPIAAQAKLGPYTIEVLPGVTPMQMSGSIKPPTISATVKNDGYDYKYSAEIAFKVDVITRPKNQPGEEPVNETPKEKMHNKQEEYLRPNDRTTKWDRMVNEKGVFTAVVLVIATAAVSLLYRIATRGGVGLQPAPNGSIMSPFIHTIDRNRPIA